MVKVAVISCLLTALAVVLMGIRVFFVKDGKFPSSHAHSNESLKKRGVECHKDL